MPARWLALGVGAYLAFAVVQFPADVAYRWFAPDPVRLSGVQGTVWSGRATLGSAGSLGLHDVRWRMQPWSLVLARPGGRIEAGLGDGFLQADVRIGGSELFLSTITATCGLPTFASTLPIAGIGGQVSLQLAELVLRDGRPVAASGQLLLGQLIVPSLVGGEPVALGNYRITLFGTDGLQGRFEDRGGPLEVRGSANLTAAGDYEISGLVRARPEANAALRQGVELLAGAPDDTGMRAFSLTGTL